MFTTPHHANEVLNRINKVRVTILKGDDAEYRKKNGWKTGVYIVKDRYIGAKIDGIMDFRSSMQKALRSFKTTVTNT